ncbi:MAG: NtaA/DmoA family FMN-dependent monooxygenase, partial [Candidatus Tectomicrobia bacterium]|nr:NtaA/DmoA family FMN-dependent monooxygenase [Candidatus Tectomicrobia bacterium]
MILIAFVQASNCSNYPASWRHPLTAPGFLTPAYYQQIAQTLETGKFHLAFLDDRLAMPSQYGDSFADAVHHGIRAVKLDLVPILTAMALATRHLGVGATYSTTYYTPFHVARLFATLDHLSTGRAAWNVVTSLNDAEAQNFGQPHHLDHDRRYDQADEFMQAVYGLWETWAPDALVLDKSRGYFADATKVQRLEYQGHWVQTRGPLTVPRPPQGAPVVIQAGQSHRGRRFAARWGELIFVLFRTMESSQAFYAEIKAQAAAYGRAPDSLKIAPAIYVVVAETEQEAHDKLALIESLAHPMDTLVLLSEIFNYDFAQHALDAPLDDDVLASLSGLRGLLERVIHSSGKRNPTLGDVVEHTQRGTIHEFPVFVGTPTQVADAMEAWVRGRACDGFVLAATHMPGAYEDF